MESVYSESYQYKQGVYYQNARPEMLKYIPLSAKKILEVGCGAGAFGIGIKNRQNCEVWGIEPNKTAASDAKNNIDYIINDVFREGLEPLENQKFDCIVFNDVIEHIIEPSDTLQSCKAFMNDDSIIVASIPNILYFHIFFRRIILKEDWQYEDAGILDYTHYRFYTRKSIIRLFESNGFTIQKIEGINKSGGKLYTIMNLLLLNKLKDWKYLQFAVVAKKTSK